jgi:anti-sigma-K factor RskA
MISFDKKITAYLDGSLGAEETSEFEAFVLTHPEFEAKIKNKKDEIQLLKSMIPTASPSEDTLRTLETEIKSSVFNLLKQEPKSMFDSLRMKWEEWTNQ